MMTILCSKQLELCVLCLNMAMFWHIAVCRIEVLCPVSNSVLGLLYGHGILTIYENLLLR